MRLWKKEHQNSKGIKINRMIQKVAVIGSGTMGSGIAQVAATAGCTVKIYDTNLDALSRSKNALDKTLSMLLEKGKIDAAVFANQFHIVGKGRVARVIKVALGTFNHKAHGVTAIRPIG